MMFVHTRNVGDVGRMIMSPLTIINEPLTRTGTSPTTIGVVVELSITSPSETQTPSIHRNPSIYGRVDSGQLGDDGLGVGSIDGNASGAGPPSIGAESLGGDADGVGADGIGDVGAGPAVGTGAAGGDAVGGLLLSVKLHMSPGAAASGNGGVVEHPPHQPWPPWIHTRRE
jgi:hypothetical protein